MLQNYGTWSSCMSKIAVMGHDPVASKLFLVSILKFPPLDYAFSFFLMCMLNFVLIGYYLLFYP